MPIIEVSAVIFRDSRGRILQVRKRGTTAFQFPGGKPEAHEKPADAAVREVAEELTVHLDMRNLVPLGTRTAPASNEPGYTVLAHLFEYPRPIIPQPAAEIVELAWVDHANPHVPLAPLSAAFR
ncbi:NUDIX domain-containing protein [Corynebacterium sp. HMSC072G08]|uniref:NUDIX hydrolase n=1 Tax=Corynebacterium sp. HMSC072G08 TaxID=1715039 RepID=UPI0009F4100D